MKQVSTPRQPSHREPEKRPSKIYRGQSDVSAAACGQISYFEISRPHHRHLMPDLVNHPIDATVATFAERSGYQDVQAGVSWRELSSRHAVFRVAADVPTIVVRSFNMRKRNASTPLQLRHTLAISAAPAHSDQE